MSDIITYQGTRAPGQAGGCRVVVRQAPHKERPLPIRLDLRNHSPTGFQWGYGGSGPAQLALALCVHIVGVERGLRVYQDFKFCVIAHIQTDVWQFTLTEIMGVIEALEQDRRTSAAVRP